VATLDCASYDEFQSPGKTDYPCRDAYAEQILQCSFGGEWDADCTAFCDKRVECQDPPYYDHPACMNYCAYELSVADEMACEDALRARLDCVAQLGCADYQAWDAADGVGDSHPCADEDAAEAASCG
jgi:hypothetical protein